MTDQDFILRLAVRTKEKKPFNTPEEGALFHVDGVEIKVEVSSHKLTLIAKSFSSENDAKAFMPRLENALWMLACEVEIAFYASFDVQEVIWAPDPAIAAKRVGGEASVFGLEVHGIAHEFGFSVYPVCKKVVFLSGPDLKSSITRSWQRASDALTLGATQRERGDGKEQLARELFVFALREESAPVKLIYFTTCLELLAPGMNRRANVIDAIENFRNHLTAIISNPATDAEDRTALMELQNEVGRKKEKSLKRRIRALAADLPPELSQISQDRLSALYDARSRLVHEGYLPEKEISEFVLIARMTVGALLKNKLLGA